MNKFILPLVVFIALVVLLSVGLKLDPKKVPSPLIDKPAPAFSLSTLFDENKTFDPEQMKGKVWLLNVWASWCVSCRQEHPLIVELSRTGVVTVIGLNYKDTRADAKRWLTRMGNAYPASAFDEKGSVGIDWGVYGVPETFVIDKQGIIRYKQIGPVTREALNETILPLVKRLQSGGSET